MKNVQKLSVFVCFLFFLKLLYSAACLAPGISPPWVQRSIFNKHIMKKQAYNAAAECSDHPTYGSAVFHLFVHRRFVCCSSLTATFPPEAFIKDWHGRNGLSGTGSLEPLGSMDALRALFHSERDAATVEGGEADYHSANKNEAWCETRAKTKGCIRVFPQDEAVPTATVCHTEHTQTLCVRAGWWRYCCAARFIHPSWREGGHRMRWKQWEERSVQ